MTNAPNLLLQCPYREVKLFQHSPFANRFRTTHFDSLRAPQNTIAWTPPLFSQKTRESSRFNHTYQPQLLQKYHQETLREQQDFVTRRGQSELNQASPICDQKHKQLLCHSTIYEVHLDPLSEAMLLPASLKCTEPLCCPLTASCPGHFSPPIFHHSLTQHVLSYLIRAEKGCTHQPKLFSRTRRCSLRTLPQAPHISLLCFLLHITHNSQLALSTPSSYIFNLQ